MKSKNISFRQAEFAYARHLRDVVKHEREIIYPNEDKSNKSRDGVWHLLTIKGEPLGMVYPNGIVRLT